MSEGMLGNLPLSDVRGPRNDLDEKLASAQGPIWLCAFKKFLRRENPWGIPQIIEVTSDGSTGEEWISRLEGKGFRVGDWAKEVLRGSFLASNGATYRLAVISGDEFEDGERTNARIRAEAANRGYMDSPMEVAPYLREMFSDEDLEQMGVYGLIVMHDPVADSGGRLYVLGVSRDVVGRWLHACRGHPASRWKRERSFVFLAPASS